MADAGVPAALQNIEKRHYIRLHIGVRVGERITHPSLGGEVHEVRWLEVGKQRLHPRLVRQVHPHGSEPRLGTELRKSRLLQPDVVVGRKIVDADNDKAAPQKPQRDMKPDETGGTCDDDRSRACKFQYLSLIHI